MDFSLTAQASVELFSVLISGTPEGLSSGSRLNFFVQDLGCTVVGELEFANESLQPGESSVALISFFDWGPFKALLQKGLEMEMRQGSKAVGYATITALNS